VAVKKKRKLSPAQKRALAKGRAALARKRKGLSGRKRKPKRKTKRKRSCRMSGAIVLPEGTSMARRRKRRKARRRRTYRGSAGVPVAGRRRRSPRRRRRYYGGKQPAFIQPVIDGALVVGGAVGGSFVAGAIPGIPSKFKPFIPMVGGIALNALKQTRRNPMMRMLGIGMITASGLSLVRQFAPQVPLMTGEVEDELMGISEEDLLGLDEADLDMLGVDEEDLLGVPMLGEDEDDLDGEDDLDEMMGADYMLPSDL